MLCQACGLGNQRRCHPSSGSDNVATPHPRRPSQLVLHPRSRHGAACNVCHNLCKDFEVRHTPCILLLLVHSTSVRVRRWNKGIDAFTALDAALNQQANYFTAPGDAATDIMAIPNSELLLQQMAEGLYRCVFPRQPVPPPLLTLLMVLPSQLYATILCLRRLHYYFSPRHAPRLYRPIPDPLQATSRHVVAGE